MKQEVEVLDKEEKVLTVQEKQNEFAKGSLEFKSQCLKIIINTDDDYQGGAELMKTAAWKIKSVKEFMDPDIKRANDAHKGLTSKKKSIIDPLDDAKKFIGQLMARFDDKIEAEKMREAIELAEKERIRESEARKLDEQRKETEAKTYDEAGDKETAKQIREAPTPPPVYNAPLATIEKPKAAGISFTIRYEVEVVVKELLPLKYLEINQSLLNKEANNFKGQLKIPGCVIKKLKSTNTRIA